MTQASGARCRIHADWSRPGVVLHAAGALDAAAVTTWDRCVSDILDDGPTAVTLDLTAVTFMASAGLRLIVDLRHQLQFAGTSLVIVNSPPKIARLLQLTGMTDAT